MVEVDITKRSKRRAKESRRGPIKALRMADYFKPSRH